MQRSELAKQCILSLGWEDAMPGDTWHQGRPTPAEVERVIEYLESKGWAPAPDFSEKACASVRVYLRGKSEEEMRALFAADGAGIDLQLVSEMPTPAAVKWAIPSLCGALVETAKHINATYFAPLMGVAQGVLGVFTQLAKAGRV